MKKTVDLADEEFSDESDFDSVGTPSGHDWFTGAGGYTLGAKLGVIADYMKAELESAEDDGTTTAIAALHGYVMLDRPQHAEFGVQAWGIDHLYPRFWTTEPVSRWMQVRKVNEAVRFVGQSALSPSIAVDVRQVFERNHLAWRAKKQFMSSLTDMVLLPEYQRIIGLGAPVLPLIIESLRTEPDHWFWALVAIVGEDHAAGAETLREAADKWIAWFDAQVRDE